MPVNHARRVRRLNDSEANDPLKSLLLDALDSCSVRDGSFASFGPIVPCDPDLFVHGIGRIKVPLSNAQAKQLIAKSQQAAGSGTGSESTADATARNHWQLNPGQFDIRGAVWQTCLDNVLVHVANELGITCRISAELHGMLLVKADPTRKTHIDTGKDPGAFGTLVIDLPSPHKGGDIVTTHWDATTTLATSECSMSCAFWYSNVSHEVLPIKYGYRWALTYNLKADPSAKRPTTKSLLVEGPRKLYEVLRSWILEVRDGIRRASPLHYVLDHRYPMAQMSYGGLEVTDRLRVKILREICADLGFDFFLTTIERRAEFGGYHTGRPYNDPNNMLKNASRRFILEDATDISYRSRSVFDLEGNEIISTAKIDTDTILQGDGVFGENPSQTNLSRIRCTYWYWLSALVIVPCPGTVSYFTGCFVGSYGYVSKDVFEGLTRYLLNQCRKSPKETIALKRLHEFLRYIWYTCRLKYVFPEDIVELLQLIASGDEPGMVDLVFAKCRQPIPVEFFSWARKGLDESALQPRSLEKVLIRALKSQTTLRQFYEAISIVNGAIETTTELQEVVSQAVDEALKAWESRPLYEEDGRAIFEIAFYHQNFSYLKTEVLPIIEKRSGSTAFVLGFLKALQQSMKFKQITEGKAMPIYKNVAQAALRNIDLGSLSGLDVPSSSQATSGPFLSNIKTGAPISNYVTYASMLRFISSLISFNLERQLVLLTDKICNEAAHIKGEEFDALWIPLLQGLLTKLEQHEISASKSRWTRIYQSLFNAYLSNYVRNPPPKPTRPRHPGKEFDAWAERKLWAEDNLEAFDQEKLRLVLGDQYVNIMSMKSLQAHETAAAPAGSALSSPSRSPFADVSGNPSFCAPHPETPRKSFRFGGNQKHNRISSTWRGLPQKSSKCPSSPLSSMLGASSRSRAVYTHSRPTSTVPNPVAGSKRKFVEVIDLTEDD
ncbi:hypothetical protein F5B20DRAFT_454555 [Whalleya microplaca]|nr:hypothetical protein F5B20DRAFT_454555 [Whalleya microplaca]